MSIKPACLVLFAICTVAYSRSTYSNKANKPPIANPIHTYKFRIFDASKNDNLINGRELRQKIDKELKKQAVAIEEARRRKIYLQYLLRYQGGSNILRDFHSSRFF